MTKNEGITAGFAAAELRFFLLTAPLWHDRNNLWSDRRTDVRSLNSGFPHHLHLPNRPPPERPIARQSCDANRLLQTADEAYRKQATGGSRAVTGLTSSEEGQNVHQTLFIPSTISHALRTHSSRRSNKRPMAFSSSRKHTHQYFI